MLPFTREQLIGVINKRRPVSTPFQDRHFPAGQQYSTRQVQLDIQNSPEGLAVAINAGVESTRAARHGWETQTITIPRFSEHDLVKAADHEAFRLPGRNPADQVPLAQHVNRKLDTITSRFDRTAEFMCVGAMRGEVKDGNGTTIATYQVDAAQNVTFNTDTGGDDPLDVMDDAVIAIARELGGMPGNLWAYCGVEAYKKLRNQHRIEKMLQSNLGPQMLDGGELAQVSGIAIQRMPAVFIDNQGAEQPFVHDNEIIVASDEMDAETIYGPCETPEGSVAQRDFVDQWDQRDPAGTMLRLERNPFPLARRPRAVRRFTVS
mgnify:CR=1 FL=1